LHPAGPDAKSSAHGLIGCRNADIGEEIEVFLGIKPDSLDTLRINTNIIHIKEAYIRKLVGKDLLDLSICVSAPVHIHFLAGEFNELIHGRI
jgi:hypothetical protein